MTVTRQQIRQVMLDKDMLSNVLFGTATAGAVGTLTDTSELQVGGNSVSQYGLKRLYRPAANNTEDVFRRITAAGYAPSTGILTHGGPDWTEAPLGGTDDGYYEIWPFDPNRVNRAISRALTTRCFQLVRTTVTIATSLPVYDITAAPFSLSITDSDQLLEVEQSIGSDPTANETRPWDTQSFSFWPELDSGTLNFRFDPRPSGTLQTTHKEPFSDLTDETTTSTVDSDYIAWGSLYELFIGLEQSAVAESESEAQWNQLKAKAYGRFAVYERKFMDRFAGNVIRPQPRARRSFHGPNMARTNFGTRGRVR